jgi:hypothetical protein
MSWSKLPVSFTSPTDYDFTTGRHRLTTMVLTTDVVGGKRFLCYLCGDVNWMV